MINHPDWANFVKTPEFANSFRIVDSLLAQFSKVFETYYNSIIAPIAHQQEIVQGITSNLGNGPLAPINPDIPVYELKNNWIAKLGNSPEEYFTKI